MYGVPCNPKADMHSITCPVSAEGNKTIFIFSSVTLQSPPQIVQNSNPTPEFKNLAANVLKTVDMVMSYLVRAVDYVEEMTDECGGVVVW
jgi:hypothetical protein